MSLFKHDTPDPEAPVDPAPAPTPPVDPAPVAPSDPDAARSPLSDDYDLPKGTAYVTPDGLIGVIGAYRDPNRPLATADVNALFAFQNECRKEASYR